MGAETGVGGRDRAKRVTWTPPRPPAKGSTRALPAEGRVELLTGISLPISVSFHPASYTYTSGTRNMGSDPPK